MASACYVYAILGGEAPLPADVQIEIAHEFYRQWLPKEAIPAYLRYLETQPDGPDVFVHYTQIEGEGRKQLFENDTGEFEIKEGPKGLQALNVRRVSEAQA
mgnify:CR=1 FL=1